MAIQYDSAWDNLTKHLVCRSGPWHGPSNGYTRTILNIDDNATVAHEVMIADNHLYLGVEGYNADGTLVIPTMWAECGRIYPGANSSADPSANPNMPIYQQLDQRIKILEASGGSGSGDYYTKDEIDAIMGSYITDMDSLIGGDN